MLQTKRAPIASLNLLEFKVLQEEVPTESLTWRMMLVLTKSVTKMEIHLEQECWFLCERDVWTEMAKTNASRYWASWGPLKSLEVLGDKYFMQGIEKRLLQNLLKYKDYHWFQQASDQAQCEWVSEYVYIVFCRQNTSFSAQDLSQLDVWQPWTRSHVTAYTVQSPNQSPCWKTENINLCSAACSIQGCVEMHICSERKQNDFMLACKRPRRKMSWKGKSI